MPPKAVFSPSIPHPNIYTDGIVSLSYLDNWNTKSHLWGLITEIYQIMKKPNIQEAVNINSMYDYMNQKERIV